VLYPRTQIITHTVSAVVYRTNYTRKTATKLWEAED